MVDLTDLRSKILWSDMYVNFNEVTEIYYSFFLCLSICMLGGLMGTDLSTGAGTSAGKDGIPTYYSMFFFHHIFYIANNCTNYLSAQASLTNVQENVMFV